MDTKTLVIGQDVFLRSQLCCDWGKVIEITTVGVIVESDPHYGAELIQFDKDRNSIGEYYNDFSKVSWKLYLNPEEAGIVLHRK